jgi:hypothetical protein
MFMVLDEFFSGHNRPPPNLILRNAGHILPPHLRFPLIVSSDLHLESQVEVSTVSVGDTPLLQSCKDVSNFIQRKVFIKYTMK